MKELGRYDTELQMFVEPEKVLDLNVLQFYAYLVATGKLDDDTDYWRVSVSSTEYSMRGTVRC